ncbi:malate/lactate/ureidoglycolate dehydrogenase [Variovorax sp. VNK109]|uniref:malate/lactate/ureidoglycolate dehydrogenase n=1 Tax=Variovorax sp. VNK109 TaxID=3400919 RepID=UPI003C05E518
MAGSSITLDAARLRSVLSKIFVAAGSSAQEAQQVADNLVMANLSGHDSHGAGMTPRYVDAVKEGGLKPNTGVKVTLDSGALLALDAQHGYGQVTGPQAMELAMARTREHGSCIMTLARSHHLGRIGHFAEMAAAQGFVSLHFVNVMSRPVVAPWGGGDGRFGTNPCCIGIPLGTPEKPRAPFILDFATSRAAQGKMRVAHNKGQPVPPGYLIDAQGRPTTDPGVVVVPQPPSGMFGAILAFGEHKGYGMAIACELLGGALSGGGTWHQPANTARAVHNSMLSVLIDPRRLGTQAAFESESAAFLEWLKKSPPGTGFDAVQIAGEPELAARAQRERDGIVMDSQTWAEIVAAGAKVGLTVEDSA